MSNNTNLSKLANVLDDASDGQYLKSTGSGGVVFDAVAAGTTTVADITALEALTAAQGDMAFVLSNNNVYIRKTAGWYKIAQVTNNQLESVTVTMSGGGTAGDTYKLALDGTDTTATGAATDPEGLSVTWSAAPISPATLSGSNIVVSSVNVATITQGTGANSNVFTIDPVATTGTHNFSVRFSVTDGINATINADKDYTLNFVLTVDDSKYTTMLAQAVGANNGTNSSITDSHSSSSPHTITTSGSPVAGTFSPYRSGGYSAYFTGSAGDRLTVSNQASNWSDTGTATIEFWFHSTRTPSTDDGDGLGAFWGDVQSVTATRFDIEASSNDLEFRSFSDASGNGLQTVTIKSALTPNTWYHLAAVKNGQVWKFYLNGTLELTHTQSTTYNFSSASAGNYNNHVIGQTRNAVSFQGYITDVKVNSNQVYTAAFPNSVPTERLTADSNTTFFYNGTGYIGDTHSSTASNNESITVGGDVATKPIGPYDSEAYAAAANGGSIYFDGTSDNRVIVAHDASLNPTGAWTIECWFYLTDMTNFSSIFSKFDNNTSNRSYHLRINSDGTGRIIMSSAGTASDKGYTFTPTSGAFTTGQWYHFAQVYDGSGTYKYYVNGVAQTDYSWSGTPYAGSADFLIGTWQNGSTHYGDLNKAYVSDLRLVIGTAVYSGASLTVPTVPLGNITNTKLLVKGTDASIIDKSGSTALTLVGDAKCSTDQVRSGVWANTKTMYFDGSSDYITTQNLPALGTSDFTAEAWVYETSQSAWGVILDWRAVGGGGIYLFIDNGILKWGSYISAGSSLSTNTWYHVAVSRSGTSTKLYINGTQTGSTYSNTNDYTAEADRPCIGTNGYNPTGGLDFEGYMQDVRVTIGLARYTASDETSNIPTAPLEG